MSGQYEVWAGGVCCQCGVGVMSASEVSASGVSAVGT